MGGDRVCTIDKLEGELDILKKNLINKYDVLTAYRIKKLALILIENYKRLDPGTLSEKAYNKAMIKNYEELLKNVSTCIDTFKNRDVQ